MSNENETPALAGEVWRSPVTPDGSVYAVVRLDDGATLAARLWIGDAWVGVMVSRWLLDGIATERAAREKAEGEIARTRIACHLMDRDGPLDVALPRAIGWEPTAHGLANPTSDGRPSEWTTAYAREAAAHEETRRRAEKAEAERDEARMRAASAERDRAAFERVRAAMMIGAGRDAFVGYIVEQWIAEELSEGMAAYLLGVDRLTAREMRIAWEEEHP